MRTSIILAVAVSLYSCRAAAPTAESVRPVKVIVASHADYLDKDFAGLSTPDDVSNLAFRVAGQVMDIPVSKGQSVKRGELLAQLDPRDIELQVSATRSAFDQARSQLDRARRLLEHEAVSRQEYEGTQTQYAQAKSAYENAADMLKDTKLRAPFAGVVERKFVDNFERIQPGEPILRLVNPVTTTVSFTMPESGLYILAQSSTKYFVEFDNYRSVKFTARLKDYAKTSSDASGFPVSLTLFGYDAKRYNISPGMSCTITIQSTDKIAGAMAMPLSAVYAPASGGDYMWVVGLDNRVELRPVTLGEIFGKDMVIVDKGIKQGDRVVVAGVYQLRKGDQVTILK